MAFVRRCAFTKSFIHSFIPSGDTKVINLFEQPIYPYSIKCLSYAKEGHKTVIVVLEEGTTGYGILNHSKWNPSPLSINISETAQTLFFYFARNCCFFISFLFFLVSNILQYQSCCNNIIYMIFHTLIVF